MRRDLPYKRGTSIRERVEPKLLALGYDTSTLQIVRFGGGSFYEIVLEDRIVGSYTARRDELRMFDKIEEKA